jgi:hypothetical protein
MPPTRVWVLRDPRPLVAYNFDYYGAGGLQEAPIPAVRCLLLATLSPSDGRACYFAIERAPQINLRRWPPLLAHILYDALAALKRDLGAAECRNAAPGTASVLRAFGYGRQMSSGSARTSISVMVAVLGNTN